VSKTNHKFLDICGHNKQLEKGGVPIVWGFDGLSTTCLADRLRFVNFVLIVSVWPARAGSTVCYTFDSLKEYVMMKRFLVSVAATLVLVAMAATSKAGTISVTAASTDWGATDPSIVLPIANNDLLQTNLSSSSIISGAAGAGSALNTLYDGAYGSCARSESGFCPANPTTTVEFVLDTSGANSKGYDISSIVSTSGFYDLRSRQNYDVYVKKVGETTYSSTALYSVANTLSGNLDQTNMAVQVTAVDSTGLLASGVSAIEIVFHATDSANSMSVYREFDVNGTATVPEPGTLALLAGGLIGLICYAWRKRKN
jgi:hypothetical protein